MEIYIIKCKAFGEKNLFFVLDENYARNLCKVLNGRIGLKNLYFYETINLYTDYHETTL